MSDVTPELEELDPNTGTDVDLPENEPDPLEVSQAQRYEGMAEAGAPGGDPRLEYEVDEDGTENDVPQPVSLAAFASSLRLGQPALDYAQQQHLHRSRSWYRDCLYFVRSCFNAPSYYGRAEWAYYGAQDRHTSWPPPPAVPVFWTNGTYGHVVISAGHGYCWSSDFLRYGYIDKVRIASITSGWGQHYRGWSEDINRVRVYHSDWWTLDISSTIHAARHKTAIPNGEKLKQAIAKEVGMGEMKKNNTLGTGFREQYQKVQVKYLKATGQTVTKTSADGIPGRGSLSWLGGRRGFNLI